MLGICNRARIGEEQVHRRFVVWVEQVEIGHKLGFVGIGSGFVQCDEPNAFLLAVVGTEADARGVDEIYALVVEFIGIRILTFLLLLRATACSDGGRSGLRKSPPHSAQS